MVYRICYNQWQEKNPKDLLHEAEEYDLVGWV